MSKLEAQLDARLPVDRQYGKMNCYCKQNLFNPLVTFDEYKTFNFENYKNLVNGKVGGDPNYGYNPKD